MSLLDRRIVIVTGKGGVGKTTLAAALGRLAVRRGRTALVAEVADARLVPPLFGRISRGYALTELAPGLQAISITSEAALEDYLVRQLRVRALYRLVFRNRVMGPFMEAVPGLHDLITLGKVWDLAQARGPDGGWRWDHIIVDAPATGHGLTMLAAPAAMMRMTVAGPFHDNARLVHDLVADPDTTGILLVSLPADLPVNETLELARGLGEMRSQLRACVINEVHPRPFPDLAPWPRAREHLLDAGGEHLAPAVEATDFAVVRARRLERARNRLARSLEVPVHEMPFLVDRRLGPADISRLAAALDRGEG